MTALLLFISCVKSGALPQDEAFAHLTSTTWTELCPGSDPVQTWIQLRPDGGFNFAYPGAAGWSEGDNETWTLDARELSISWNGGFATSVYTLEESSLNALPGVSTKSCGDQIQLVAAPEGPDFSPGPVGLEPD